MNLRRAYFSNFSQHSSARWRAPIRRAPALGGGLGVQALFEWRLADRLSWLFLPKLG